MELENLEKDEHEKTHLPTCGSSLPRQNNRGCLASTYSTSWCVFKIDCRGVAWQVATSYTNRIREMTNKVSIIQTPFTSGFTHLIEKKLPQFAQHLSFLIGFTWNTHTHTHTHTHTKKKITLYTTPPVISRPILSPFIAYSIMLREQEKLLRFR